MQLTNFSIGDDKANAVRRQFETLEKGGPIAGKNGLTLQEVTGKDGKKVHRWLKPDGAEHAEHGAKVSFDHDGKKVHGTVGRVSKNSGKYVIKDKDGTEYKKHPHEFKHHTDDDLSSVDDDSDKQTKPKSAAHAHAMKHTDKELADFITKYDKDATQAGAVKAAKDELQSRFDALGADDKKDAKSAGSTPPKNQVTAGKSDVSKDDAKVSDKVKNDKPVKTAQELQDESDEQENESVNQRFDDFEDYVEGVVMGYKKSAIMYGPGGVGKTFTTVKKLKDMGLEFFDEEKGHQIGDDQYDVATFEGGKITPTSFYQAMWEHNGKVLLFDDCDTALQYKDIKGYLKGALGSNQSTVTNASQTTIKDSNNQPIPKQFKFTGKMIFISNLPKKYILGSDMQPIMSRSFSVDMTMSRKDTVDRIRHISTDKATGKLTGMKMEGHPNYTHEEMEDVISLIDKYKDKAYDVNARTVETLMGMKKLADKRHSGDPVLAKKDFERKAKKNLLQHLDKDGNDISKAVYAELHKAFTTDLNETIALAVVGEDITQPFEKSMVVTYEVQEMEALDILK